MVYLYEVVAFMLEIPEDEDEKEVERDHYNWQLVAPFNTLITLLIEANGMVAGELSKNTAISELKRECFTMDITLLLSLLTRYSLVLNDHCEISEELSLQSPPQPSVDSLLGVPSGVAPATATTTATATAPAADLLGMPSGDAPAPAAAAPVADLLGMPAQASVDDLLGMPAPQSAQAPQLSVDDLLGGVAPSVPEATGSAMGLFGAAESSMCSPLPIEEPYKPLYNEAIQVAKQLKLLLGSKDFPLNDLAYLSRLNDSLRTLQTEVGKWVRAEG